MALSLSLKSQVLSLKSQVSSLNDPVVSAETRRREDAKEFSKAYGCLDAEFDERRRQNTLLQFFASWRLCASAFGYSRN